MRRSIHKILISSAVSIALLALPARSAFGWGEEGHRMIVRIAVDLMPPGERAPLLEDENFSLLDRFVLEPDRMSEGDRAAYRAGEGPNHYLNIEGMPGDTSNFEAFRRAARDTSSTAGRVIPRIHECVHELDLAVSNGRRAEWLKWAGYLAHYVGDAHQPLHTTTNHDGRESGNLKRLKGDDGGTVHVRFESGLVNHKTAEIEVKARDLATRFLGTNGGLDAETARFRQNPDAYVCSFIWGAHGHVREVVDADNAITGQKSNYSMKKGRYYDKMYDALGGLAASQIARAALAVAAMWHSSSHAQPLPQKEAAAPSAELSTPIHNHRGVVPHSN